MRAAFLLCGFYVYFPLIKLNGRTGAKSAVSAGVNAAPTLPQPARMGGWCFGAIYNIFFIKFFDIDINIINALILLNRKTKALKLDFGPCIAELQERCHDQY